MNCKVSFLLLLIPMLKWEDLFIARGPDFKEGVEIEPFENIHIYPAIIALLGLKSPKVDGDTKVLSTITKP